MYEPSDYVQALREAFSDCEVGGHPTPAFGDWWILGVTDEEGAWWALISLIPQEDGSYELDIDHPEAEGINWEATPWQLAEYLRSERLLLEVNWPAAVAKYELL